MTDMQPHQSNYRVTTILQDSQKSMYVAPVFCFKLSGFCGTLVTIQTFLYRQGSYKIR